MSKKFVAQWNSHKTGESLVVSHNPKRWTSINTDSGISLIGSEECSESAITPETPISNGNEKNRCTDCGISHSSPDHLMAHKSVDHESSHAPVFDCLTGQKLRNFIELGEFWIFLNSATKDKGATRICCKFTGCVKSNSGYLDRGEYIQHLYMSHQGDISNFPMGIDKLNADLIHEDPLPNQVKHGFFDARGLMWIGPYSYNCDNNKISCKVENWLRGEFHKLQCTKSGCGAEGTSYISWGKKRRIEIGTILSATKHSHVPEQLRFLDTKGKVLMEYMKFENFNFKRRDVFDLQENSKIGFIRYTCLNRNCSVEVWVKLSDENPESREVSFWITECPHFHATFTKLHSNAGKNCGLHVNLEDKDMYKIFKEPSPYYEDRLPEHYLLLGHDEAVLKRVRRWSDGETNVSEQQERLVKRQRRNNIDPNENIRALNTPSRQNPSLVSTNGSSEPMDLETIVDFEVTGREGLSDEFPISSLNRHDFPKASLPSLNVDNMSAYKTVERPETSNTCRAQETDCDDMEISGVSWMDFVKQSENNVDASFHVLRNSFGDKEVYDREFDSLKTLWKQIIGMESDQNCRNSLSFLKLKCDVETFLKCVVLRKSRPFTIPSKIHFLKGLKAEEAPPESLKGIVQEVLQHSKFVFELEWLVFLSKLADAYHIEWKHESVQCVPIPAFKDFCPIDLFSIGEKCKFCGNCGTKYCLRHFSNEYCKFCDKVFGDN